MSKLPDTPVRMLICGDRDWTDSALILFFLKAVGKAQIDVVIEGEARGADSMAREAAETLGIPVLKFPANWNKFKKGGGPIRNTQMLVEGKPTLVVAFHDDITKSKGTKDMLDKSVEAGVRCLLVSHSVHDEMKISEYPENSVKRRRFF